MHKLDAKKFPVTICTKVDMMNLSLLLCCSGLYLLSYTVFIIWYKYINTYSYTKCKFILYSVGRYQENVGRYGIAIKYHGIRYYLNITVLSLIWNFISICRFAVTTAPQCIKQLKLVVSHKPKPAWSNWL